MTAKRPAPALNVDFGSIDWAEPGAWPRTLCAVCLVVAGAVAAALGYVALLAGPRAELLASERQERALLAEQRDKTSLAASVSDARSRQRTAGAAYAQLHGRLLPSARVPDLVEHLHRAAATSGLAIEGIELGEEQAKQGHYRQLPVAIVATGDYHSIGAFAAAVAALPHIVTVGDFAIHRPAGDAGGALRLAMAATAYLRYADAQASAAADAAGSVRPPRNAPAAGPPYRGAGGRSPFARGVAAAGLTQHRPRQALEAFPLESLRMVGTLGRTGAVYALVQAPDGRVHRVGPGDHVGAGRVAAVSDTRIDIEETVPDDGGLRRRSGSLRTLSSEAVNK